MSPQPFKRLLIAHCKHKFNLEKFQKQLTNHKGISTKSLKMNCRNKNDSKCHPCDKYFFTTIATIGHNRKTQ